jgi:heme/copper-type cytochrome/quinol oxidase subunit 2
MKTIAGAAVALLFLPRLVAACAVCFGAADSPMVHGQNSAILALLAVVGVVQVGVVKVIWDFRKRAKRLPPPPTAAPGRRLRIIHGGKH